MDSTSTSNDTPKKDETNEMAQASLEQMKVSLTDEEKAQIKANKDKKVDVEVNESMDDVEFSDDELAELQSLYSEMGSFITDKVGLGAGSGKIETIPSGIELLDTVMGGGAGVGTMTVIAGNPGTFKSALAGHFMASAQKKFKGKALLNYLDSESATTMKRLYQMGVRYPPVKPIDTDITVEMIFKTIETLISFKELKGYKDLPGVVVWDSIANTTTEVEKNQPDLDINKIIGLRARILSFVLPRYISRLRENKLSLIAINQLRDKIDMGRSQTDLRWMGTKNMPGGNSIKFNAFHLLLLKVKSDFDETSYGFKGVELEAKLIKNKLFPPNIPIKLIVDFSRGISNYYTKQEFLFDNGAAKKSGWCKMKGWDGAFRCREGEERYNTDPEFRRVFDEHYNSLVQTEIIDKYSDDLSFLDENDESEE